MGRGSSNQANGSMLLFGTRTASNSHVFSELLNPGPEAERLFAALETEVVMEKKTVRAEEALEFLFDKKSPYREKLLRVFCRKHTEIYKRHNPEFYEDVEDLSHQLGIDMEREFPKSFAAFSMETFARAEEVLASKIQRDGIPKNWVKTGKYALGKVVAQEMAAYIDQDPAFFVSDMPALQTGFKGDLLQALALDFGKKKITSSMINKAYDKDQMALFLQNFFTPAEFDDPSINQSPDDQDLIISVEDAKDNIEEAFYYVLSQGLKKNLV